MVVETSVTPTMSSAKHGEHGSLRMATISPLIDSRGRFKVELEVSVGSIALSTVLIDVRDLLALARAAMAVTEGK